MDLSGSTAFPGDCAVAGIGASAGGLEAFSRLLKNLPVPLPMAFVFVQHLDPHHESGLVGLLASCTSMPVLQAVDGTPIQPNHVYVIPPNTLISMRGCRLFLTPRESHGAWHLPIDHFLCSLAEDLGNRSIGVILSGGGADGAIGLEAIKSEGGITFAQDRSARHESMPRQAIAAGVVDFVLTPEKMALELASLARLIPNGAQKTDQAFDTPVLHKILQLLHESCGVNFIHYKTTTIQRRLARRLALRRIPTLDEYLVLLKDNPEEIHNLFEDILITVTDFFRDPEVFESLLENALPGLLANRAPTDPLRVWVAGCSTGKEAYSIAIALAEATAKMGRHQPIQLFGTDISERVVEVARLGRYPETIASRVSPERLERFFVPVEGGYQIARNIRDFCVFSRQDVTKDPPLARMDLISCRNLLIYMSPVLQRRVISIFGYALNPGGCLVLSHSESVGTASDHFKPLDPKHKIYLRDGTVPPPALYDFPSLPFRGFTPARALPFRPSDEGTELDRIADDLLLAEYAPPGFLLNSDLQVVRFRGDAGPYLAPPAAAGGLNVLDLVNPEIAAPLRRALDSVAAAGKTAREHFAPGSEEEIAIVVRPVFEPRGERHYLVAFESPIHQARRMDRVAAAANSASERSADDLALDLLSTRLYMQRLVAELRAANEEGQSANEELQSTNEELQTAKEELQSSNEELITTNEEMVSRSVEIKQVNTDLVNLLSSLQLPILMLDRSLHIRRYTPVSETLFRLIPGDVGRPISDLQAEFDMPNLIQSLRQVVASGVASSQEIQDNRGHWYALHLQPYRAAEDRIEGVVVQMQDIDALKKAMDRASAARDYAGAIISTVHEALIVLDGDLRVKTVSRSFCTLFAVTPEEAAGHSIDQLCEGRWNRPAVHELLAAASQTGAAPPDLEVECEWEKGDRRIFLLNARRIGGPSEQLSILLAIEDIGARKRVEEARYLRLFEKSKDGILILDAVNGVVTDVNPSAVQLLGERDTILGRRFWEVTPVATSESAGARALERLRSHESVRFPDLDVPGSAGPRTLEIVGSIYPVNERAVIQLNIRDITERRQFDHKLQQTAKLESLGLLAGGIAHDFNNLLTGIMGNASLALLDENCSPRSQNALGDVIRASQRAAELTSQMLAYAGKGRYVVRAVDMSEMVREISALLHMSIPRTVVLELNLAPGLPPVEADASQLHQVIMNLIINAAESIEDPHTGSVRVSTRLEYFDPSAHRAKIAADGIAAGSFVVLEVIDSGSGMESAVLARIFDPFYTTKFTGRGLGLAAVQGIIRGHNGALTVESVSGKGTTFRVFLPAGKPVAPAPPVEKNSMPQGEGTILIVDDEPAVSEMAKAVVEMRGYTALVASDGAEAVRLVTERGGELAAVLLDLTMPVMGGEEALEKIRLMTPDLPVILSTGYDSSAMGERMKAKKIAAVLQKPYTASGLLKVLKSVTTGK